MFRNAKQIKKERKDVIRAKYIKDERGDIKIQKEEVMDRWRSCSNDLLIEENEYHLEEMGKVEGPVKEISEEEVKRAIKGMKSTKVSGPTGVTSDMLKKAE